MEITRGYKTELDLNNQQRTLCLRHAGCARYAYNWGLARKQAAYAARKAAADPKSVKIPTAIDLHRELNALKQNEFPWMYASSKCAPQEALRDLDTAFSNFFAKRAKYPKFKKRSKGIGSFTLTGAIHGGPNWMQLPVIGKVRLFEHGYLPQDTDLNTTDRKAVKKRAKKKRVGIGVTEPAHYLSATISEHAGHWFISVQVKQIVADPEPATGNPIGVDLGLKTLAVCSDGQKIPNPNALRSNLGKLKRTQRHHSKRKKGSTNRKQSKQQVARVHYRIGCLREDALHQATAVITAKAKPASERPHAIILEDLTVAGMLNNHKLAQAIADVGLGEFRRQMTYKSRWYGNRLYLAHPFFPSTQLCSQCHRLPSVPLDLSMRTYHCEYCGLVLDRDRNAARNLVWLYTASSAEIDACGEIVRPAVLALRAVSAKQEPNTE
jgi:putative transposase